MHQFVFERQRSNMSFLCQVCGFVYDWEMFFNKHMRAVHKVKADKMTRCVLKPPIVGFLKYYYDHICERPELAKIKELAKVLDVKKEKIYWWFFNQRQRGKKSRKHKSVDNKNANDGKSMDAPSHMKRRKRKEQ